MNILEAFILGLTQELTEWLPVSSSGNLVILEKQMALHVPVFLDALLHATTVMVVLVFLKAEVADIPRPLSRSLRHWRAGEKLSDNVR